ncbi:MAG: hypothetical protein GJ676_10865 [Rhodobacteraceae bacterium]|nr:hypothetical protein [Paracoccaceae bacterium]
MLQDKRNDLDAEKRKALLQRIVQKISQDNPAFYYLRTSEIAVIIEQHVSAAGNLNAEDRALLAPLSRRDIEILLSLH